MTTRLTAPALLTALLSLSVLAQQPAKVSIQGVVSAVGTNEPIAGVGVNLYTSKVDPVTTDSGGRFEFKNLDQGRYRLSVWKNGYLSQDILATSNMTVRLTPAATVSGRILQTSGRPAANVPVQLLQRAGIRLSAARFGLTTSTQTNDLGEYRMNGVPPGSYYVAAGHRSASEIKDTDETSYFDDHVFNGRNNVEIGYEYTYWPGIAEAEKASVLDVSPGARLEGIDFSVPLLRTYRIQGRVIDPRTNRPPSQIDWAYGSFGYPTYDPKTGTFVTRRVAPGRYAIGVGHDSWRASALVVVGDSDVEGVLLTLEPEPVVTGTIRVEGVPLSDAELGQIRVRLSPPDPAYRSVLSPPLKMDGSFTLDNINTPAVPYRVEVPWLPSSFYIKEARFGEVDVLNEFALFSRSGNLGIVVSSRVGQVKGLVTGEESQAKAGIRVVLIPDKLRNRSELYKTTTTDESGRFTLPNIAPGDYKVFAWERVEYLAYMDAQFMEPFEQQGKAVRVRESSEQSVELKILPASGAP